MSTHAHTLLLIDDDLSMHRLVSELLKSRVKHLWLSENPHEGLRLALTYKPSLILLDNHMPSMNGTEVLQHLREMPGTRDIPVIMMTADNQLATVTGDKHDGVAGYLLKPCDPEQLLAKVGPLLGIQSNRQQVEVQAALNLDPEQEQLLTLHSVLNVLSVLSNELHILALAANDLQGLSASNALIQELKTLLIAAQIHPEVWPLYERLDSSIAVELAHLEAQHPELGQRLPLGTCRDNIASILGVLAQRMAEIIARADNPWQWRPLSIVQVRQTLINNLEAIALNSHGRYHIVYRDIDKHPADYLVDVQVRSHEGPTITLPLILQDVFRDLTANARKYTAPGGQIYSTLIADPQGITLTVSDNGRGLDTHDIGRLVQFGQRGHNVQDKLPHGGGFGLTKAWAVTQHLGGRMWIASAPGEGTTITLKIPYPQPGV
jgi:CheY-like chemotaxis protein